MCSSKQYLVWVCALAMTLVSASAENWGHWRGPLFNGSSPETKLPAKFSKTENVLWAAEMPGSSAATPVIWGERIFISSLDRETRTLVALCYDHASGKRLWRQEMPQGSISHDQWANYSSPSPVTDGKVVVFFYGNGEMAAFDLDGKKLWGRNIQKDYGQFAFLYNFSSSPTLFENHLYLQVLQRNVPVGGRGRRGEPNECYLLALDPVSGKELWRHVRPSQAREESLETYSTPIPLKSQEQAEILVAGADCLTGHDAATGKELWRWGTWNPTRIGHWRLVPSPVVGDGVVLVCAPKRAPVYAVKLGGKGELDGAALAWKSQDRAVTSDVSTPLFYQGRFYVLHSDQRSLSCVEPQTGKVLWSGNLESRAKIESSPTGADDKIYMMNFRGDVFVVGTGDAFELLHKAEMGDERDQKVRASVAVSQGRLFVRTESKLYCIGVK